MPPQHQDWFELQPEIRCNGDILTEKELRGLMGGGAGLAREYFDFLPG